MLRSDRRRWERGVAAPRRARRAVRHGRLRHPGTEFGRGRRRGAGTGDARPGRDRRARPHRHARAARLRGRLGALACLGWDRYEASINTLWHDLPVWSRCLYDATTALRLLPMSDREKDVEILALRHQLGVLQRQLTGRRPQLRPEDRTILAALVVPLTRATLRRLRLVVNPDTVLPWHRDLMKHRHDHASMKRGLAARARSPRSTVSSCVWQPRTPVGATGASTANSPRSASRSPLRPCGRSSRPQVWTRPRSG